MRICSLLPSATEIVADLGLVDALVGVSEECRWPPEVVGKPVVTAPKLGAAALFAFILAGQAVASLAVDHFGWVGFDENPVTPGRLLGVALVAAGVAAVRFL